MAPRPVDFQAVSLHVRHAHFEARVVHVHGPETTLALPRGVPGAARPLPADAELTFEQEGRLIMLSGTLLTGDEVSARFRVGDGITARDLRRFVRLAVPLPVVLTPLGADGLEAGPPEAARTRDISAGGVLVDRPGLEGAMRVELELPGGGGAVSADGLVIRTGQAGSAIRFESIDPEQQRMLDHFVVGVRHQLARRFAAAR
jgi:PilZ domain-containing protein